MTRRPSNKAVEDRVIDQVKAFASAARLHYHDPTLYMGASRAQEIDPATAMKEAAFVRACTELWIAEQARVEREIYRVTWSNGQVEDRVPGVPYFRSHPDDPTLLIRWLNGVEEVGHFSQEAGTTGWRSGAHPVPPK